MTDRWKELRDAEAKATASLSKLEIDILRGCAGEIVSLPYDAEQNIATDRLRKMGLIYSCMDDDQPTSLTTISGDAFLHIYHELAQCRKEKNALVLKAYPAMDRVDRLEAENKRLKEDLPFVIGWNDGFEHAMKETMNMQFPTMLRKMWSGGEVQAWIDEKKAEARAALKETNDE